MFISSYFYDCIGVIAFGNELFCFLAKHFVDDIVSYDSVILYEFSNEILTFYSQLISIEHRQPKYKMKLAFLSTNSSFVFAIHSHNNFIACDYSALLL